MEEHIRILCVDDEKNVLSALKRSFLQEGYEILTASSGEEGLSMLKGISPVQVVISDFRMPEMNGIEFLRQVRREWPDTIRIALTAYADVSAIISSINEGHIHYFLLKPWTGNDLKSAIGSALEQYFLHRENRLVTDELLFRIEELKQANFQLGCRITRELTPLRDSCHEMAARILDSLPAAVTAIDHAGKVIYSNNEAEKYMERRQLEAGATDFTQLFPAEIADFVNSSINSAQTSGAVEIGGKVICISAAFGTTPENPAVILLMQPVMKDISW